MAIVYINVSVGSQLKSGEIPVQHAGNGVAQASHVSIAFDNVVVTNVNQLRAALSEAMRRADQLGLAKGS